ncbi:MAG: prohibitin family protein [Candidatus Omnitrophota bacterium]|jgi:regulator of protease activity HflC (stomatin/prohibitin superfamily)|nr:MAG: prohibitin family protein [Candidatus Omnitrophota bacterium]
MGILIILVLGFIVGVIFVQTSRTGSIKPVVITTIIGLVAGLLFGAVRIVPAGYVGVVDFFGNVSPNYLRSGINFVNPLAKVILLSVRTLEAMEIMPVPSKEGLTINLDISILYRLDQNRAVDIYKTVGPFFRDIIVSPTFRSAARGVTVSYEAKALYTSERELLSQAVFSDLKKLLADRGIVLERVLLRGIQLPPTVSQAIEQKLKAEQEAERMKFILQREKLEADRKRVEAEGIRDAQTIINQSLTAQYLQYLWINTLNQNPNVIYVATEANMPMFRAINPDEENLRKRPILKQ